MLSAPWFYQAFHRILGTSNLRSHYVNHFVQPKAKEVIVDIGCGPADILNYLGEVRYIGIDYNLEYIEQARKRWPNAEFHHAGVENLQNLDLPKADCVMANAVLHHLNDAQALNLYRASARLMGAVSRFCSMDNFISVDQHFISRYLIMNDRGQHVRSPDAYSALCSDRFIVEKREVREDLLRVPYSIVMLRYRLKEI